MGKMWRSVILIRSRLQIFKNDTISSVGWYISNIAFLQVFYKISSHLYRRLSFNEAAGLWVQIYLKKRFRQMCFAVNFTKFQEHLFCRKSVKGCFWQCEWVIMRGSYEIWVITFLTEELFWILLPNLQNIWQITVVLVCVC